jgi:hypothetical protein
MIAVPMLTAVTRPDVETVATNELLVVQVNARVITSPSAVRATAVSCCVSSTSMLKDGGVTTTIETGGVGPFGPSSSSSPQDVTAITASDHNANVRTRRYISLPSVSDIATYEERLQGARATLVQP